MLDKYKTEFGLWSKKTAQATLEMCRVVCAAKKELETQNFLKFCTAIGRKGEDATVRKYLRIGEKYEKFYQYADLLPNSWTSIYEITQLPSDMFEALVTTENSMANMTGNQIKLLTGKSSSDKSKSSTVTAASTTAQLSTDAREVVDAASMTIDQSTTATSPSDVPQFADDLVSAHSDPSNDEAANESVQEFAKQATAAMLEQVSFQSSISAVAPQAKQLYEVLIRFKTMPTDDMWWDLVEEIDNIVTKYNFNVEVIEGPEATVV